MPWIQVDRDFLRVGALRMSVALGVDRHRAIGLANDFWDWSSHGGAPGGLIEGPGCEVLAARAAGWDGDPVAFVDGLEAAGLVERVPEGLRVRGLDRYEKALTKNERDAERLRTSRRRSGDVAATSRRCRRVDADADADAEKMTSSSSAPTTSDPVSAMGGMPAPKDLDRRGDAPDRRHVPAIVTKPDTPPEAWTGEDFFRWAQFIRQKAGLAPEQRRPRELGSWYSGALMLTGGAVQPLKEAFYGFGDDEFWKNAKPPLPFAGFIDQWTKWLPRGAVRNAGA